MARPYSLRRRLLLWLMVALLAVAALAVVDTWREAQDTATSLSDRVLAGSVLGVRDEYTSLPVNAGEVAKAPPEPLRWPAVRAAAWALARLDSARSFLQTSS